MENSVPQNQLTVSSDGISHLASIRKWAQFLAVLGFVASGLMVIFGFFFGAISRTFGRSEFGGAISSIFIMILYIGFGILYFFPSMWLFKFSANLKSALETYVDTQLTEALKHLRSVFTFMGVLTIIGLAVCVLAVAAGIVIAIIGAIAANN